MSRLNLQAKATHSSGQGDTEVLLQFLCLFVKSCTPSVCWGRIFPNYTLWVSTFQKKWETTSVSILTMFFELLSVTDNNATTPTGLMLSLNAQTTECTDWISSRQGCFWGVRAWISISCWAFLRSRGGNLTTSTWIFCSHHLYSKIQTKRHHNLSPRSRNNRRYKILSFNLRVQRSVTDLLQKSLAGSGGDSCQTRQEKFGHSAVTWHVLFSLGQI